MCMASIESTLENFSQVLQECNNQALRLQGSEQPTRSWSPSRHAHATESVIVDEENVDVRIQRLRNELLRLQKSRESRQWPMEEFEKGKEAWNGKLDPVCDVVGEFDGMKENMMPRIGTGDLFSAGQFGTSTRRGQEVVDLNASYASGKNKSLSVGREGALILEPQGGEQVAATEVECGDLVLLLALAGGRKKEIGKAIVMGMAGSKYVRKVIPKGWHLVKVYTYTDTGALQEYPFPAGWAEQVKHKTVKDAEGRNILWPDSLLHM